MVERERQAEAIAAGAPDTAPGSAHAAGGKAPAGGDKKK